MVSKKQIARNPPVKAKDKPPKSIFDTIALNMMPGETINLVIELLPLDMRNLLELQELQPPVRCRFLFRQTLNRPGNPPLFPNELLICPSFIGESCQVGSTSCAGLPSFRMM